MSRGGGRGAARDLEIRIGLFTVGFVIPGSDTLKEKRMVLRRILGKAKGSRQAFNVGFAEVGERDDPRRSVVAATTVSNDADVLFRVFESLRGFFEAFSDIVVEGVRTEVIPVNIDAPLHAAEKSLRDLKYDGGPPCP